MKNTVTSIAEATFERLGISYKKLPCRKGEFFYCKSPTGDATFNLKYDENGIIRLWRFVATAPISKAGKHCVYRKPDYPYAKIGIEVTDEGDVCFFAEQAIDINDPQKIFRIDKMISGYINLIADC